jgi:hypothetical protein
MLSCCDHDDASHGAEIVRTIDVANLRCLNEALSGSVARVFRSHCTRADKAAFLDSFGDDPDLLLSVPFSCTVRLRSIVFSCGAPPGCPARARLFVNQPNLDFDGAATATPAQELAITGADENADGWHALRGAKFNNITSLQIHFSGNLGGGGDDASVRIFFVGLRAEVTGFKGGIVNATYEVVPVPTATGAQASAGASLGHA